MKRFWDETVGPHWMQLDGRIGCAFSSAGGWGGGMELACQSILTVLMNFGFLTFGVISNRFNTANADGRIDETELDHLMLLVVDIDNHGGNVDINQYPGGT
jgi:multimeric flavodoxin WrbA